jgi:hypothetical protein
MPQCFVYRFCVPRIALTLLTSWVAAPAFAFNRCIYQFFQQIRGSGNERGIRRQFVAVLVNFVRAPARRRGCAEFAYYALGESDAGADFVSA